MNPCTNCHTHIEQRPGHGWVHQHTWKQLCRPDDLAAVGMSADEVGEQIDGVANYSACPVPPNEEHDDA